MIILQSLISAGLGPVYSIKVARAAISNDVIQPHSTLRNWDFPFDCLLGIFLLCKGRPITHQELPMRALQSAILQSGMLKNLYNIKTQNNIIIIASYD